MSTSSTQKSGLPFGAVPTNEYVNKLLSGVSSPRETSGVFDWDADDFGLKTTSATFTAISITLSPFCLVEQTLVFPIPVTAVDAICAAETYMRTPMTAEYYDALFRAGVEENISTVHQNNRPASVDFDQFQANRQIEPDGTLSVIGTLLVDITRNDANTRIEVDVLCWDR